jgi:phage terminase Nu1 subunit (DNA packaging protein)
MTELFIPAAKALLDCTRRFKNLPDRHVNSVETLVRQHLRQAADLRPGIPKDLK